MDMTVRMRAMTMTVQDSTNMGLVKAPAAVVNVSESLRRNSTMAMIWNTVLALPYQLAAMTVPGGVDYDAPDGKPSSLLFMIAAPPDGDVHLEILSRLMVMLMEPEFCDRLRGAKTAEEFIEIIDAQERAKYPEETPEDTVVTAQAAPKGYRILAVTACPTGIAHTYMAAEALEKAGLKDRAHHLPGQLSGGERQMVAMGRALMMQPSVLLLDEPSAGLSPMMQDETFIRVRQVNKAGGSVVIVEQNARRCLQICDRGYVLDQGRNAYSCRGRDLMNDPKVISLYLGNLEEEVEKENK